MNFSDFFTFSSNTHHTRGHAFKLFKNYSRTDMRKNLFTRRVINAWNDLLKQVISTTSTDDFEG